MEMHLQGEELDLKTRCLSSVCNRIKEKGEINIKIQEGLSKENELQFP